MKSFNSVEAIAILECKQMNSNSFYNEITNKLLTHKSGMYIHLNECKQMTDVKLLPLHNNTLDHLTKQKDG